MNWKGFVKDYLTFSKKDRTAVFCVLACTILLYLLPRFFAKAPTTAPVKEDTALSHALALMQQKAKELSADKEDEESAFAYTPTKTTTNYTEGALFAFDPNTLSTEGWKKLGLNDRTIKTLINYRNKGGHFYKDEDLKKIWGLPGGFYERVKNYITIAHNPTQTYTTNFLKTLYERKERTITTVDVNTADTTALIALPGIGSRLAYRITNFRDKLGGFYTVEQIGETYGLPDSTFQKLKPYLQVHGDLKKFNINTATKEDLKAHPYIRWNLANAIVEYRAQHGVFKKLDDLKNIVLMDEATFQKIAPYFKIE